MSRRAAAPESVRDGDGRRLQPALRSLAALLLPAMLAGCGDSSGPAERGLYYWGGEVNVVCPCGAGSCYWVRGEPAVLNPLKSFVQRRAEKPYQPMFIRYRGSHLDEAPVGFGANYDGLYRIDEVLETTDVLPEDCPAP